jgi:hypothetical protein
VGVRVLTGSKPFDHRDTEVTELASPATHFSREAAKVAKESIANI